MKIRSLVSEPRRLSNIWLNKACKPITGRVLSIGSGNDRDGQGSFYKNYFPQASSYTTSEYPIQGNCNLCLDVQDMSSLTDDSYDCIFCSGVLEHVHNFYKALDEITRVLSKDGILLLGLPFNQAIHMPPHDYWRFTKHGILYLLEERYAIIEIEEIGGAPNGHPATYWIKAVKL